MKDLATVYNPSKGTKYAQFPERCINGTAPTLVDLRNAYGNTAHVQWLIAQFATYQEGINTPNKMTTEQLMMLSQAVATEFYYLKTSEVMLFLARLAGGVYNVDFHGYVSPDVIMSALRNQFIPYRNKVIEWKIQEEQERREKESMANAMTREEYEEIKMLTAMYDMIIPGREE